MIRLIIFITILIIALFLLFYLFSNYYKKHKFKIISKFKSKDAFQGVVASNKARTHPYEVITNICPKIEKYLTQKTGRDIHKDNLKDICTCIPFKAETHLTSHKECEGELMKNPMY